MTRQRIVAAAAELIFERGVATTTVEAVQAAANVSASQLYHYFGDKEALVRAVIEHQTETIIGVQESADLGSIDGLRAWRDMVVGFEGRLGCRGGCPIGSLGSQLAETDTEARVGVAAGFGRWEDTIRSGRGAMQADGTLRREANVDDLALALLAAMQGGLLLTQMRRDVRPLEVALDAMIDRIESLTT
jgi:TetR/AcrR family transcriptional repressor of nem operon